MSKLVRDNISMQDIKIPQEILREIADSESDFCRKVRKCDPFEGAKNLTPTYKNTLNQLERFYGKERLQRSTILEIGSGNGFFLCYALKVGLNIVGIEPGKTYGFQDRYSRAIKLMKLNGIQSPENFLFDATIENLPFKDNTFDVVFNVAVLEHVQSLDLAMRESVRVLKPDGILWANIPNYNSIYEGHYDIFWIPYMKKNMAKLYVKKLFGRDPYFIDELNFTTPSMFKKYLNSHETFGELYLHSWGLFANVFEIYKYCLNNKLLPSPEKYPGIKKIVILLLRIKPLSLFLKLPLYVVVKAMEFFGLAITFDMILYKRLRR